ncbi:MAG: hypothetical protein P8P49_02475, partial [Opitutales bacterium]|nr:hypothetical protein [Opitutales bacterium]
SYVAVFCCPAFCILCLRVAIVTTALSAVSKSVQTVKSNPKAEKICLVFIITNNGFCPRDPLEKKAQFLHTFKVHQAYLNESYFQALESLIEGKSR